MWSAEHAWHCGKVIGICCQWLLPASVCMATLPPNFAPKMKPSTRTATTNIKKPMLFESCSSDAVCREAVVAWQKANISSGCSIELQLGRSLGPAYTQKDLIIIAA